MFGEVSLYLELLLFLAGALLYGFLTRELHRRPEVLPGNWPLRALSVCLTVWYGGTLLDYLLPMMFGLPEGPNAAATALDIVRASAWLLSLSLLVHNLEKIEAGLATEAIPQRFGLGVASILAYLPLALFVLPALRYVGTGEFLLAPATQQAYPRVVLHAAVTLVLAGLLSVRLARRLEDPRIVGFLRLLTGVLGALLALLVVGLFTDPWSPTASGLDRFLRTLLLGGLLVPGVLFAFYVQRYNLLRLSLSHGSLRHFLGVLLVAMTAMAAGPAVGVEDLELLRRFVAWGLLLALFLGVAYTPLSNLALRRFPALRRLMGKSLTPQELDRLMDSIQSLDVRESAARERTVAQLGQWLGSDTTFLPAPEEDAEIEPFWRYFEAPDARRIHRLQPPTSELATLLARRDLHAVFPLRVAGRLEGLLGLGTSPTGGGYADGEIEAVRLVMRQLAANLTLRRTLRARLDEEQRLAEQERLSLLGLVSASLAHEIKNPLSSMKALAQALKEDLAEDDPDGEGVTDLALIVEQIDRLDQTAREILGVARPRPGEATELTALVQSAVYILQAEARKRAVELDGRGVEEVPDVPGSPARWQTVVMNLMLNAIEHTPSGGTARVRLWGDDGVVKLETANPGGPLSEEEIEHLFEPFVSEGGTGLGLTLVARRLDELGGQIDVECRDGEVVFRVQSPL